MPVIVIGSGPVFLMVMPVSTLSLHGASHRWHKPEPIRIYHQTAGIAPRAGGDGDPPDYFSLGGPCSGRGGTHEQEYAGATGNYQENVYLVRRSQPQRCL